MNELKPSAKRVQDELLRKGYENKVIEISNSARTAQEAADALNCEVAQIAKSIIFKGMNSNQPILVITSGSNRVNESKIEQYVNEPLGKASPEFVKEHTGFVIGGVSPIAHTSKSKIFIDEDLYQYTEIWAAAGHPKALFKLTPAELKGLTNGEIINVK